MTAADVASINLHSDVYHVLQLMSPQDTAFIGQLEVSLHNAIGMCFMLRVQIKELQTEVRSKLYECFNVHILHVILSVFCCILHLGFVSIQVASKEEGS